MANKLVMKMIRKIQRKTTDNEGAILYGSINTIISEIEKIHINKVKEILIKALNQ